MSEPHYFLLNQKENFISEKSVILRYKKYYFKWIMATVEYTYDGIFEGNILVVGQIGCRKTTFIQKLAKNNLFGELKEIFRSSKIPLSVEREKTISVCFQKQVHFKYLQTVDDFNIELAFFQRKQHLDNDINIVMGENNIYNKLIVMDNVSGLC